MSEESKGVEGVWHVPTLDNTEPKDGRLKIKNSLRKPTDEDLWHVPTLGNDPEREKKDKYTNPIAEHFILEESDIPEIKNDTETDKDNSFFVCGATLNIEGDEDASPIAEKNKLSVADGCGGSGSRRMETGKTTAYYGSRAAQEVISSLSESDLNQEMFQIKNIVQERLNQKFSSLPKVPESIIKSKLIKDYPTTISTAILKEDSDNKSVKLLWTGDSPIFIFTPNTIYTTAIPESGDAPTDAIYRGNYHLDSRELTFNKDTPLMVVVASDGLLKMGQDTIATAIRFILENTQNTDPSQISQKMIDSYQQANSRHEIELDDTTIALAISGDISKFSPDAPIKLIS